MPNLSEVSKNAKRIKEQIAEQAGVAPKDVNDANLGEAGKILEGAKKADDAGHDPLKLDPGTLKQAATGEADVSKAGDISKQQKIAMAITAIAPTLLGYAFGGAEGGAIGAQTSQTAIKQMGDQANDESKFKREQLAKKELKQMEVDKDLAVAGERAQDRHAAAAATAEQRKFSNALLAQGAARSQEAFADKQEEREAKAALAASLDGRLGKLSKEKQDSVIKAKEALQAVQGMSSAYKQGDNTFSLVGDNDYTRNRTWFEEALGRMQSGGAITRDEEVRFRRMAPGVTDSAEQQQKKLVALEQLMQDRLKILGFSTDDFGIASNQVSGAFPKTSVDLKDFGFANPMVPTAAADEAPAAPGAPRSKPLEDMNEKELEAHNARLRSQLKGR